MFVGALSTRSSNVVIVGRNFYHVERRDEVLFLMERNYAL